MNEQRNGNGDKEIREKIGLVPPTMHGSELKFVKEAYETNWMSKLEKILMK